MTGKLHWACKLGDKTSPGPADYKIDSGFGKTSPRYSIRKRCEIEKPIESPDYHDIPKRDSSPRYTIRPKTERKETSITPGPSYMPPPMGTPSIKTNRPKRNEKRCVPRKRKYEIYNTSINGPAEVNIRKSMPEAPAFSLGGHKETKWITISDNPGPSDYLPTDKITRKSSPSFSIRATPKDIEKPQTPGPADYKYKSDFGTKVTHIHIRHKELKRLKTPGPGSYEIVKPTGSDSPSISIHIAHRDPVKEPTGEFTDLPSIFGRGRKTIGCAYPPEKPNTNPSPAHYSPRIPNHKYAPVLAKKWSETEEKETLERRKFLPQYEPEPGPADYSPDYGKAIPESPRYSFGGRFDVGSPFPDPQYIAGPGDYEATESRAGSPRFSIKGRNFSKYEENATQNAGFLVLPEERGLSFTIGRKNELELIPK